MHWVYVIKCSDEIIYIGETKKLFSRLYQHETNKGSKHTCKYKPQTIIALYIVGVNYNFFQYLNELHGSKNIANLKDFLKNANNCVYNNKNYALEIENFLTECNLSTYENTFGGKYVNENKFKLINQMDEKRKKIVNSRPFCFCNLPAEIRIVKQNKYYKIFYTCCRKNIWDKMRLRFEHLNIPKCCSFYSEYLDDIDYRVQIKCNE